MFNSQQFFLKAGMLATVSQLTDSNCLPARYEGAALPGELSWHKERIQKKIK